MIMNISIQSSPTQILQGSSTTNYAIILISVTNLSSVSKTFNLYVCQNGKTPPVFSSSGTVTSGNIETTFLYKQTVPANSSVILNSEKILLGDGDTLYLVCNEDSTSLVATVSYEMY